MQDDTRDVLAETGRSVKHGSVRSAHFNGIWDLLGLRVTGTKPRSSRLVTCKEAFTCERISLVKGNNFFEIKRITRGAKCLSSCFKLSKNLITEGQLKPTAREEVSHIISVVLK